MARKFIEKALRLGEGAQSKKYEKRVKEINALEEKMEALPDEGLLSLADSLRERAKTESLDDLLVETFALVREASKRTIGQRQYDVQLLGGQVIHDGGIPEMKTGEGKTLTAVAPVFLGTLKGDPVHVVTVNDYLADRDSSWMKPIYDALGASVSALSQKDEPADRKAKYRADIVYGTNSEFGFDYLRDNMAGQKSDMVQRGHSFALVDEVDNILIDEARTPLIISGSTESAANLYSTFARLAKDMKGEEAKQHLRSLGESRDTSKAEYDYEYDEKFKTVAPTEKGVRKAEQFLGVENLYLAGNGSLVNHLQQALKAEALYKKDRDYAVIDDEVLIIDEFTGRIMEGRRWSEGLHQAVEAKEGVRVQEENQTLATITLQNYFRMYEKLAGMTGTALTEATEFMKIYKMPTVEIPTHRETARADKSDLIYKTKDAKWNAVAKEIKERNEKGQPVLVGTISVEVSEDLSRRLQKEGVDHVILNAKPENAEKEGHIVAHAGRLGRVTIATNMAGRGVDIKLGGDPDAILEDEGGEIEEIRARCKEEGEKVRELGGLMIIGTERHESRRIDNQLRGRAGRQGDPGESRFYLSAEDDLIRLFAGDKVYNILDKMGEAGDKPLESKILTRTIEGSQKKVEQQNFLIRKKVLEYDDVLNEQRRVVYKFREDIINGGDISDRVRSSLAELASSIVDQYLSGEDTADWDMEGLLARANMIWGAQITQQVADKEDMRELLMTDILSSYDRREAEVGSEILRVVERIIVLHTIDSLWREHLYDMDYLREGIHLRGFAQIDPLVAYKNEGFKMFEEMMVSVWDEAAPILFNIEINDERDLGQDPAAESDQVPAASEEIVFASAADIEGRPGRNDPCPCGSGKKYKRCCGV